MPQMAPIKWLSLFIIFSISFLIFNMMNYYLYTPIMPNLMKKKLNMLNTFNWKW